MRKVATARQALYHVLHKRAALVEELPKTDSTTPVPAAAAVATPAPPTVSQMAEIPPSVAQRDAEATGVGEPGYLEADTGEQQRANSDFGAALFEAQR